MFTFRTKLFTNSDRVIIESKIHYTSAFSIENFVLLYSFASMLDFPHNDYLHSFNSLCN